MSNTTHSTAALLRILAQWNRWGEARLESGRPREVVEKLGSFLDTPEIVALIGPRRAGKTTVLFQVVVRRGLGVKKLVQVTEGLKDPAVRRREVRPLVEGAARFPEAEPVLVADVPPPDAAGDLAVRVVPLWRFLVG